MYKPNPTIINSIKRYDKKLCVEWNNVDNCWEVYRQMAWGKRLITPIVESIYVNGGNQDKYMPLDNRIVEWLFSADTKRRGLSTKWKWLSKLKYLENKNKQKRKTRLKFNDVAKDMYGIIGLEMINPFTSADEKWIRPDIKTPDRIMTRSEQNRKDYFK